MKIAVERVLAVSFDKIVANRLVGEWVAGVGIVVDVAKADVE